MERTSITPDPEDLRALTHPVRLRMLSLLRLEGPATATMLAERLGLNTGATSYHLRTLGRHGFIREELGRGSARERWWRAAQQSTRTDVVAADDEEEREITQAYLYAVATTHSQNLMRAVDRFGTESAAWREAGTLSDWGPRLTPEHARDLVRRISAQIESVPEDDTPDARPFLVNLNAYLHPDASDVPGPAAREE